MATSSGRQQTPVNQGDRIDTERSNKRRRGRIQSGWTSMGQEGRGRSQGQPSRGRGSQQPLYVTNRGRGSHYPSALGRGRGSHYPSALGRGRGSHYPSATGRGRGSNCSSHGSYCNESSGGMIGQPSDVRYTFETPTENIPLVTKAEDKLITEDGVKVLSTDPSGDSVVELINGFLDQEEADRIFSILDLEIDWKQQINKNRAGNDYKEPREVCWYGEHPYAYSKVQMHANLKWPSELLAVKKKIEERANITFNSVLANKYRNEQDGVAWHSDDEYGLRDQPTIASLSMGVERMFEMRKKPPKGHDPRNYTYKEKMKIPLKHGTLLIMSKHTQDDWQHQVPKEYHARGMRINLTFRNIYPDPRHTNFGETIVISDAGRDVSSNGTGAKTSQGDGTTKTSQGDGGTKTSQDDGRNKTSKGGRRTKTSKGEGRTNTSQGDRRSKTSQGDSRTKTSQGTKESSDGAGTKESPDGAGTKETPDGAGTKESPVGGGTKESPVGGGTKESAVGGGTKESPVGAGTKTSYGAGTEASPDGAGTNTSYGAGTEV